uniref:Uncharacterized protein n=1 Tax=Arion vulgaris TaxID=1028688 RepID=A0A0B6ZC66_9EUPU
MSSRLQLKVFGLVYRCLFSYEGDKICGERKFGDPGIVIWVGGAWIEVNNKSLDEVELTDEFLSQSS